ncbi:MAG: hypothetical protein MI784_11665 [Cytophagales bacterium]|nr:hypothetical protein [Cytophagales bacterium]
MDAIDIKNLTFLKLDFYSGDIPPPYCNTYEIFIDFKDNLATDFELDYFDREDLSENEILDEGFTLDDNFKWKGMLPTVWKKPIEELLAKTTWVVNKDLHRNAEDSALKITLMDKKNKAFEGFPANKDSWEQFNQELIQAIFELGERESPLCIQYAEVQKGQKTVSKTIIGRFSQRQLEVVREQKNKQNRTVYPWEESKTIFKSLFTPDYHMESASPKLPKKDGKYLEAGDGLWFELGKDITNPSPKLDIVKKLEDLLSNL